MASSSKVQVEYTDPSHVFTSVSNNFRSRLPLRNLHWNSPTRPLRSIDTLYVDLIPDRKLSQDLFQRPSSVVGLPASQLGDDSGSLDDARRNSAPSIPKRERRHQIPGLRQTPYLKVYFLRCDDLETYKTYARKQVREWAKDNSLDSGKSKSASSQENHDALEWMIVHVTAAEVGSNATWPSKASLNLTEKIRSDFNGLTKPVIDHVVPIPTSKGGQPQDARTPMGSAGGGREGEAWEELIGKMKSLILSSFDLRVRQYEEDIREKSAQRALPGWNFCTYFVLKEGLARGFENVGLVEDALIGYDELAIELQMATREEKEKAARGEHATLFQTTTSELQQIAFHAMGLQESSAPSTSASQSPTFSILEAGTDVYRELILANNISIFDFLGYVYSRQFSLLARMANLQSPTDLLSSPVSRPKSGLGGADDKPAEDLLRIGEICRRAINFITLNGGIIREDLRASLDGAKVEKENAAKSFGVVENIVASWTFSASQQVLGRTNVRSLSKQLQALAEAAERRSQGSQVGSPPTYERRIKSPPVSTPPNRNSSLAVSSTPLPESPSSEGFGQPLRAPLGSQAQDSLRFLAAYRAELSLVSRQALVGLGHRTSWKTGWSAIAREASPADEALDEISLSAPATQSNGQQLEESGPLDTAKSRFTNAGVYDAVLNGAMSSEHEFYVTYEDLTLSVLELYRLSGNRKSAEGMMADIAALQFYLGNYKAAASSFHELAPFYAGDGWNGLEICTLEMYTQCLRKLGRVEDDVQVALKLLSKLVQRDRQSSGLRPRLFGSKDVQSTSDASEVLRDLLANSNKLKAVVQAPIDKYFGEARLDPHLRHLDNHGSYELNLTIRQDMVDVLEVDQIKAKLISVAESAVSEIWLQSSRITKLQRGTSIVPLVSSTTISGWYKLEKMVFSCQNLQFFYEPPPKVEGGLFNGTKETLLSSSPQSPNQLIRIWPAREALDARVMLAPEIRLEGTRYVVIDVTAGEDDVLRGDVGVRGGSAGLRLRSLEAELLHGNTEIAPNPRTGAIAFQGLSRKETFRMRVPYQMEIDMRSIVVKLEVAYSTAHGSFSYTNAFPLSVVLPLGVNVQDVFKHAALFSKFAISTSTPIPLRLLGCQLKGTEDFVTSTPATSQGSLLVSARQPASMVYKVVARDREAGGGPKDNKPLDARLRLKVQYQCLDEEILSSVQSSLIRFLDGAGSSRYTRLLVPHLEFIIRNRLPTGDLESVALLREVEVAPFVEMQWPSILQALPREARRKLAAVLGDWHEATPTVPLPLLSSSSSAEPCAPARQIAIQVDIPPMSIVHTVSLTLFRPDALPEEAAAAAAAATPMKPGDSILSPFPVNKPIPAELSVKHTRRWDTQARARKKDGDDGDELRFWYEVDAGGGGNGEDWIVGGQRKWCFGAKEDEVQTFPLLLIPLRAGHLVYPNVDVFPAARDSGGDGDARGEVSSEVDYLDRAETAFVSEGGGERTVGFGAAGVGGVGG